MIDKSESSIPEIHQSQFKDRGSPVQQIGKDTNHHPSDVNSTNTRHLSEKFQTLHQSSIASPLNPPIDMGSRHPRPGPLLQLPGPLTPRLSTRYPRPARSLQDSHQTRSSIGGPTMPSIRRSLDQLGHGPSACSTRISSAHKLSTGSGHVQSPKMGCSGTLPPEKANGYKVLVGP